MIKIGGINVSKIRLYLDVSFIVGLVFSLFLANKVIPILFLCGIAPLPFFWSSTDYKVLGLRFVVFLAPLIAYFSYCFITLLFFSGLSPTDKAPINPSFELYFVAIAMVSLGFLRGLQITNLGDKFQRVLPWALLSAFCVLTGYILFANTGDCRVRAEAAWPFIPALLFATLSFLSLMGWRRMSTSRRAFRLLLLSLSLLVVIGYTGSRGIAVGQFLILMIFAGLNALKRFRGGVPSLKSLAVTTVGGVFLIGLYGGATGCSGYDRLLTMSQTAQSFLSTKEVAHAQPETVTSVTETTQQNKAPAPKTDEAAQSAKASSSVSAPPPVLTQQIARIAPDVSIGLRLEMWSASIKMIREAPIFGHGVLSMKPLIQDRFDFEHNHNQYLSWLLTGGVVFLVLGLWFLSIPYWMSAGINVGDRAIIILATSGFWGIAIIFDSYFNLKFYLHYFCILIGFLFALINDLASKTPVSKA